MFVFVFLFLYVFVFRKAALSLSLGGAKEIPPLKKHPTDFTLFQKLAQKMSIFFFSLLQPCIEKYHAKKSKVQILN